jgi:hypothetical protein
MSARCDPWRKRASASSCACTNLRPFGEWSGPKGRFGLEATTSRVNTARREAAFRTAVVIVGAAPLCPLADSFVGREI